MGQAAGTQDQNYLVGGPGGGLRIASPQEIARVTDPYYDEYTYTQRPNQTPFRPGGNFSQPIYKPNYEDFSPIEFGPEPFGGFYDQSMIGLNNQAPQFQYFQPQMPTFSRPSIQNTSNYSIPFRSQTELDALNALINYTDEPYRQVYDGGGGYDGGPGPSSAGMGGATEGSAGSTAATPSSPDGPDGSNASATSAGMGGASEGSAGSTAATAGSPDGPDGSNASAGGGGGGGKIICTAMNNAYGFGNFRNLVWIKYYDKHLTKAHEVGYHTLFLPLVKFGFHSGDGALKLLVRRVLEWGTRHRSVDLRAEMRGSKRDITGRVIRFIFEPLCWLVGKAKGY
jgi:hypothetical protein